MLKHPATVNTMILICYSGSGCWPTIFLVFNLNLGSFPHLFSDTSLGWRDLFHRKRPPTSQPSQLLSLFTILSSTTKPWVSKSIWRRDVERISIVTQVAKDSECDRILEEIAERLQGKEVRHSIQDSVGSGSVFDLIDFINHFYSTIPVTCKTFIPQTLNFHFQCSSERPATCFGQKRFFFYVSSFYRYPDWLEDSKQKNCWSWSQVFAVKLSQ